MFTEENELIEEILRYSAEYKRIKSAYATAKARSAHKLEHISKLIVSNTI